MSGSEGTQLPHCRTGEWPGGIASSRFASRLVGLDEAEVVLLGMPDDLGVRFNNGRPGASEGPTAFRRALAAYGVAEPAGWAWPRICDGGDVVPAEGNTENSLHETHARVTEAVEAILDRGALPVGIGGGHDLTFAFVRAVTRRFPPMVGYYLDAHLDVRETVGSGMPFRVLAEQCGVRGLRITGMSPLVNAAEHVAYFVERGGRALGGAEFEASVRSESQDAFASLDLDVLDAAHAPGVSALNPAGMTPREVERLVAALGRSPRVRCFDIMELNPRQDQDGRTARLAAHMFLCFLRGFAARRAGEGTLRMAE